ncbi:YdcF family protein [Lactiplantibacillus sp. WILCCON 0030]|uniref:YdcF family protein n=1 Tax=Lactiplantibacillus brownii TaxID=3069269 RepID=A0ABU1A628_9LACO|nr:YdcF family protein [Lactiplantibacillus brownii]MDQ7936411.1 YdcF family protein [Lactiplantibacillus brownii]
MNWFYWGSLALAIAITLQWTDRRRWLTGHFFLLAGISFALAAYRKVSDQASPLWQFMIVGLKVAAYGLMPLIVLVVAISFIRYSYRLIRKEGWQLHYSLLAIVGMLMVGMLGLSVLNGVYWHITWLWQLLGLAILLTAYFAFSFLAYLVACVTTRWGRHIPVTDIIVLGAGLMPDGRPTRTLSYRLKTAAKLYRKQRAKDHHEVTIVVSGGQGADEVMPESTAMRQYLVDLGIPRDVIQEENQSTSTVENLKFSHALIVKRQPLYRAAMVTSDYHVLRANIFARQLGLPIYGTGSRTPWYYLPFAMFREYLALILRFRWSNLGLVLALSLYYLAALVKII